MLFAEPVYLLALLLIPVMVGAYIGAHRRYLRRRNEFGDPRVLSRMGYPPSFGGQHLKFGLLMASLACLILALARPLGAPTGETEVVTGADVMLLMDVSDSMRAQDILPSRLEAAYLFVEEWLRELRGERVGVILFADEPVVLCPLTLDYAAVRTFLEDARQATLIRQGTSLGDALRMALDRFLPYEKEEGGKAILLLSDGEDHGSRPLDAAEEARRLRIPLFVVGVGTQQGSRIPMGQNLWGAMVYKRYRGQEVITRLDETLLRQLAQRSGGAYWHIGQKPLGALMSHLRRLPARRVEGQGGQRRREWFPLFAALAGLFLLLEVLLPPRPRERRSVPRRGWALSWLAGWLLIGGWTTWRGLVREGEEAYSQGRFAAALQAWEQASSLRPEHPLGAFLRGKALYRLQRFEDAVQAFSEAYQGARTLAQKDAAAYNLGNAFFRLELYPQAIEAYEKALEADPNDEDARYNLELARQKLRRQPPPPPLSGAGGQEQQPSPSSPQEEVMAGTPREPEPMGGMSPEEVDRMLRYLEEQERLMRRYFNPQPGRLREEELFAQDFFNMTQRELEEFIRRQQQQLFEPFGTPQEGLRKDW